MWLQDKFGNSINSEQLMSLYVAEDSGAPGDYLVQGNNSVNTQVASFWNGSAMTEASTLLSTLSTILGIYIP
jgi:hypothetical protein